MYLEDNDNEGEDNWSWMVREKAISAKEEKKERNEC